MKEKNPIFKSINLEDFSKEKNLFYSEQFNELKKESEKLIRISFFQVLFVKKKNRVNLIFTKNLCSN